MLAHVSGREDEFEKIKFSYEDQQLTLNDEWIDSYVNKAIKVKSQFLNYLPNKYHYKIIFVDRPLDQIMDQYQEMGETRVREGNLPAKLMNQLQSQLDKMNIWLESEPSIELLTLHYNDLLEDPISQSEKIASFLDETLKIDAMSNVILTTN